MAGCAYLFKLAAGLFEKPCHFIIWRAEEVGKGADWKAAVVSDAGLGKTFAALLVRGWARL